MVLRALKVFPRFLLLALVAVILSAAVQFACITGKPPPAEADASGSDTGHDKSINFRDGRLIDQYLRDGRLDDQYVDVISSDGL